MLVLSRFAGESINIQVGDVSFDFKIISNRDGVIRISFDAPREVLITRSELLGTGREYPRDHPNYRARREPGGIGWGDQ